MIAKEIILFVLLVVAECSGYLIGRYPRGTEKSYVGLLGIALFVLMIVSGMALAKVWGWL
jgi:hypothetical protein